MGGTERNPAKGNQVVDATTNGSAGITLACLTHVGMKRSNNEDSFCAIATPGAPYRADAILGVADGMGGHQAGEIASTLAIDSLLRRFQAIGSGGYPFPAGHPGPCLEQVVHKINAEVHEKASMPETKGMGTTLTCAVIIGTRLVLAHVGDSRAYLFRGEGLQQLTQDHTWVAEAVINGVIAPHEVAGHPREHILTRAIGVAPTVRVDKLDLELAEMDTLLLCSDGLHSMVDEDEISRVLRCQNPRLACASLVEMANANGGHDNITVAIARVNGLGEAVNSAVPN